MDPNTALKEIRDFAEKIQQRSEAYQDEGKTMLIRLTTKAKVLQ